MILGNKNDWWQPLQRRGVGRAGGGGEAAARRSREREGDLTAVVTSRDFRVREQGKGGVVLTLDLCFPHFFFYIYHVNDAYMCG